MSPLQRFAVSVVILLAAGFAFVGIVVAVQSAGADVTGVVTLLAVVFVLALVVGLAIVIIRAITRTVRSTR